MMLPKTCAYVKSHDGQTIWMYFLIENDDLFQKYNTVLDKVSADIKKEFDSNPVYNKIFVKTIINVHGDEVTNFYDKNVAKMDSNNTCLAVISLNSTLNKNGNYYLQVFLKECKYIVKKVIRRFIDDSESSFHDSGEEQTKAIKLMFLEITILKNVLLWEQF